MNPLQLLLIVVPAVWYAAGVRRLWQRAGRGHVVSVGQAACFAAAMFTLIVALGSPLDELADALFSAHMVQHLLLVLVVAPLLALGAPLVPMLTALPSAARRRVGRWWLRRRVLREALHTLTGGGVVFVLHLVALWIWHFPVPYRAALERPSLHALEHLSFVGTALLFWWVVLAPIGRRRVPEGVALLLVAGTLMQSGVLGAVLMFAGTPWYPVHEAATIAHGRTLLADQQLAGLLMWIPAGAVYMAAAAWLFLRWMRADERRARAISYVGLAAAVGTPALEEAS